MIYNFDDFLLQERAPVVQGPTQYKDAFLPHYGDVIMGMIASQITSLTIVYSTVYSDADQRKHQSSATQAFVLGIHRGPVNSPHKWPVTRKVFPFDDIIMSKRIPNIKKRWPSYLYNGNHHTWEDGPYIGTGPSCPNWFNSNTEAVSKRFIHTEYKNPDGLVRDRSNTSALPMELLQSCTKLSIWWGALRGKH